MKKIYVLLLTLLFGSFTFGQTTLAFQDFDSETTDTWSFAESPVTYEVGTDKWAALSSLSSITPHSGGLFWGMQDLDNANGGGAVEHLLTFPNISVSGEIDVLATFFYYTIGFDTTDYMKVEFFFDDVSQGQEDLDKNTQAWTQFSKVVPNGTTNVKVTLVAFQNGGNDYAGFDSIKIESGAVTTPSLSITSPTDMQNVYVGYNAFDTTLDIQNFTVSTNNGSGGSNSNGDGYISYSIDGSTSANVFSGESIEISSLTDGNHTLQVELVDNSGASLSSPITTSVNFSYNDIIQNLPFYDGFDYTIGEGLNEQPFWTNNFSGDNITISSGSLTYPNLESSTGNSITFNSSGADPTVDLTGVTSGKIYASYILNIPDASSMSSNEYSTVLRNEDGDYSARLWMQTDASGNLEFSVGQSTPTAFTDLDIAQNTPILVVFNYNFTDHSMNAWINPTFGSSEPTPSFTDTATTNATNIRQLMIRQDSGMPSTIIDEVRIGTTWESVTPNTLSIDGNNYSKFNLFPNPTKSGFVNISSTGSGAMQAAIFDILGKQVINTTVSNKRINISTLHTGVYIVKLTQGAATTTKKLIIQ